MDPKYKHKPVKLEGFSEEENNLLNLNLWLLKDIMICGECSTVFDKPADYLFHIYDAHPEISPRNTHIFKPTLTYSELKMINETE